MNEFQSIQESFYELQEAAQTGWWQANLTEGWIVISSYLMDVLGRETDSFSITGFFKWVEATDTGTKIEPLREFTEKSF